jgi:serine/threonine protein kinase
MPDLGNVTRFGRYYLLREVVAREGFSSHVAAAGDDLRIVHVLPESSAAQVSSFVSRARGLMAEAPHPNVVAVVDAGAVDNRGYIATSPAVARTLRALWNKCAAVEIAFPVETAARIVSEVSRGLAHSGRTGSDGRFAAVSPGVVAISSEGRALLDVGLAMLLRHLGGERSGPRSYMTPEQARGDLLDDRTSVYSMGILLWELLTGRILFPLGESGEKDLVARRGVRPVVAPSERAPRVPRKFDAVCLSALRRARWRRYRDCDELADRLDRLLATRGVSSAEHPTLAFLRRVYGSELTTEEDEQRTLLASLAPA